MSKFNRKAEIREIFLFKIPTNSTGHYIILSSLHTILSERPHSTLSDHKPKGTLNLGRT